MEKLRHFCLTVTHRLLLLSTINSPSLNDSLHKELQKINWIALQNYAPQQSPDSTKQLDRHE